MKERAIKNIFINGAIPPEKVSESIKKHAEKTQIGAHSIFLGQIRADKLSDRVTKAIEYTAHQELALTLMHGIREEIIDKYQLTCMHVYHSLGEVKVGELCLFVYTSSAHRKAAQQACEELVERIKKELPIWGKEILNDGQYQWKINN